MIASTARRPRRNRQVLLQPLGGMIAIGGPPCEGKGPLAARLEDLLPAVVRLQTPTWQLTGVHKTEAELLRAAQEQWTAGRGRARPTIVVVSTFGTTRARSRAREAAAEADMRFLFVEARSAALRAMRRTTSIAMAEGDVRARLDRYVRVRDTFVSLKRSELRGLPAVKVKSVLSHLDEATHRVVQAWRET